MNIDVEKNSGVAKNKTDNANNDSNKMFFHVEGISEPQDFDSLLNGRPPRTARRFEDLGMRNLAVLQKKIEELEKNFKEYCNSTTARTSEETAAAQQGAKDAYADLMATLQQYSKLL